jgi:hypothetical protein
MIRQRRWPTRDILTPILLATMVLAVQGCYPEAPTPRSQGVALRAPDAVTAGELVHFSVELGSDLAGADQVEVIDQQLGSNLLLATALPAAGRVDLFEATWRPQQADEGPYLLRAKVVTVAGEVLTSEPAKLHVRINEPFARKGPTGLSAVLQPNGVKLTWNPDKGATGYHVYRAHKAMVPTDLAHRIDVASTPSYSDSAVTAGSTYHYVVTSYVLNKRNNRQRESASSAEVKATPGGGPTDTTTPTVQITWPASDATYNSARTVTIAAAASDNVGVVKVDFYDGQTLRHSDTSAPFTHAWSVAAKDNGVHSWTAQAHDAAGNSTTSAPRVLTVKLPSAPSAPVAPTGLKAAPGDHKVTVSWSAAAGATGYNLYWATTSGVSPTSGKKIAGVTSPHVHSGLANGVTHYYVVTAVNAAGEGKASAQVSAKPMAVPDTAPPSFGGLTGATALSASQIKLSWSPASDAVTPAGVIVYKIYRSTGSSFNYGAPHHTTAPGATSFTVGGLSASTTYAFVVRARDAAGNLDGNTQVRSATTQSSGPTGPTPPFGSTVGMTAANFNITNCAGTSFGLHAQYNKYPAVVLLLNWTGFT